ncbi:hypothetical protein MUCCIDRAFT_86330 [Mucor lusitanicus CBS 277.49]|uniref:DDE Tnp4 domain-containing protein n=1 Tax=Mucor lusitanicus CBS 277.49 TaxID=747725 RepID=A0A168HB74_MUCCL|nr:hypothetical protein MUCCIDRAFT_86330 [Mucor lusitanicus CBS 277.49]
MAYYLTDGIYSKCATFVKGLSNPLNDKQRYFTDRVAAVRKDVERAFGVLQQRFNIVATPAMVWKKANLADIMFTCIILHNMIIKFQKEQGEETDSLYNLRKPDDTFRFAPLSQSQEDELPPSFMERWLRIVDRDMHFQLQKDLIDHNWLLKGEIMERRT